MLLLGGQDAARKTELEVKADSDVEGHKGHRGLNIKCSLYGGFGDPNIYVVIDSGVLTLQAAPG